MNHEDIIKLAQEAGAKEYGTGNEGVTALMLRDDAIERFAALIATAVCEKCAKVCEDFDFEFQDDSAGTLQGAAEAIRKRGNT